MNVKDWFEREKYVALHGQSWRFRVIKYLILLALATGIYFWNGWSAVFSVFGILSVLALGVHFLFRWKTKAWTESRGPYKKLDLPK